MHYWTGLFTYARGGLVVAAAATLAGLLLPQFKQLPRHMPAVNRVLVGVAACLGAAQLLLAVWYLMSPTYLDSVEASVASIAEYFRLGFTLYPDPGDYSSRGLLYGPLLSELYSLSYFLGPGVLASKLVGLCAALAALGLTIKACLAASRTHMIWAGMACGLVAMSAFGYGLSAVKSDPVLLLCTAAALLAVTRYSGYWPLAVTALLAGATVNLKIHGPLYLVPAAFLWGRGAFEAPHKQWLNGMLLNALMLFAALFTVGLLMPWLPANVTVRGYLTYLRLASDHGLRLADLRWNAVYLVGQWAPIALTFWWLRGLHVTRRLRGFAWTLLGAEAIVAVIAAKPGAGDHHMIPFLCYHAYLLTVLFSYALERSTVEKAPTARLASAAALASVLLGMTVAAGNSFASWLQFDLSIPQQRLQVQEVEQWAAQNPLAVMGVAGEDSWELTHLRTRLAFRGTLQIEYPARMDLELSGVSDAPVAEAMDRCLMPVMLMPKPGQPFTIKTIYADRPLFSDAVRNAFARRFELVQSGHYFDVYKCTLKLAASYSVGHAAPGGKPPLKMMAAHV